MQVLDKRILYAISTCSTMKTRKHLAGDNYIQILVVRKLVPNQIQKRLRLWLEQKIRREKGLEERGSAIFLGNLKNIKSERVLPRKFTARRTKF